MLIPSTTRSPEPKKGSKTVAVTGFAPFPPHTINPAALVLGRLPSSIEGQNDQPPIQLRIMDPVPVTYEATQVIPSNVFEDSDNHSTPPDFVIHIGMAAGVKHFKIEQRARRDGYFRPDATMKFLRGGVVQQWVDEKDPEVLISAVDVQLVAEEITKSLNQSEGNTEPFDVRKSDDAGLYLCEFIYYCSMRWCWLEERPRNVVFLHIPGETDELSLERATKVVKQLATALVQNVP